MPLPRPSRRGLLAGSAAGAAGAAGGPLLWTPPAASAVVPGGVHLVYGADPRHEMTVSWSTPTAVRRPRLELELDSGGGTVVLPDSRATRGVETVYHHAVLRDLAPDTVYRYRLQHAGGTARTGTLRTAPAASRPFRFVTFGDMGVTPAAAAHVALIAAERPDLAFVVGDLCYADSSGGTGIGGPQTQDLALWDRWLDQIGPSAASVPWMPTVGNHEMETGLGELGYAGFLDRFELPGNGVHGAPTTYSFVHGNVGFLALDGNDASLEIDRNRGYLGRAQDAWLTGRLAMLRSRPDIDFLVVGFHHCMYCTNLVHGSDGGPRERWEPLFDRFGVDLVINGHNHCYERTHPLRDGVPVATARRGALVDSAAGTTYVTAGGAGQTAYPTGGLPLSYVTIARGTRVPEPTTWSAVTAQRHSIVVADVTPRDRDGVATLRLRAVATDGTVIDTVTLRRRRTPGEGVRASG